MLAGVAGERDFINTLPLASFLGALRAKPGASPGSHKNKAAKGL